MIGPGTGVRVYLACGMNDMREGIGGWRRWGRINCVRSQQAVRCLRSAVGVATD